MSSASPVAEQNALAAVVGGGGEEALGGGGYQTSSGGSSPLSAPPGMTERDYPLAKPPPALVVPQTPEKLAAMAAAEATASNEPEPEDVHRLAYLIMVLLGTGLLLPYNALIVAVDFLEDQYPDRHIEYLVPLAVSLSSPPLQVLMIKFGNRLSFTRRVVAGFLFEAAVLVFFPLFQGQTSETVGLWVTLVCVFSLGVATAVLQSTVFGFAAFLPPAYTQAIMGGNGVAGLGVSLVRLVTKASFPNTTHGLRESSLIFFAIASFTTVLCAAGYLYILRLPFTQYYMERSANPFLTPSLRDFRRELRRGRSPAEAARAAHFRGATTHTYTASSRSVGLTSDDGEDGAGAVVVDAPPGKAHRTVSRSRTFTDFLERSTGASFGRGSEADALLENGGGASSDGGGGGGGGDEALDTGRGLAYYRRVLVKILPLALSVFAIFFCTFLVFPGMISCLPSSMGLTDGYFAIALITEFNLFDLIGRSLPGFGITLSHRRIVPPTVARFALVPLFVLCANPRVFTNDLWPYTFMALLAFTNGHLASVAMMSAPSTVEASEREHAGYIMSFILNFGIVSGSAVALLLNFFSIGVPGDDISACHDSK